MNLGLFRSPHGIAASFLVGAFLIWLTLGRDWSGDPIRPGTLDGSDGAFLLATGWAALACYVILALYAWRKHAQANRFTPEFGAELPLESLERAHIGLHEVRADIAARRLRSRGAVRRAARRVLRSAGASRVLKVVVADGPRTGPPFVVTTRPREPLGRLSSWMHAHIYYGLAAAGLVWLHGGLQVASPMGWLLNGLSCFVIATGLIGIVLWVFGPAWLTRHETELSLERALHLRVHYGLKVKDELERLREVFFQTDQPRLYRTLERLEQSGRRFAAHARSLLGQLPRSLESHREAIEDVLVLMGQRARVEATWSELSRIRFCMHIWRAAHVPASIVLLAFVAIHVVSVLWY